MNLPHMNLPKSWPIWGGGALTCVAITFAAWALAIGPALQQRHARQQRLVELALLQHKSATLSAGLSAARRQHAAVNDAIERLHLKLEPGGLVNSRLSAITRLANNSGLVIEEVRPGQTSDALQYEAVELRLTGSGPYPAVTRFLHRVHSQFRDMAMQSMDLSADSGNALAPDVRVRLNLAWYAAPPGRQPATAAPPVADNQ